VKGAHCFPGKSQQGITESQNHRILGVGRDLWLSPSPNPLPKQGHQQQAAQHHVQAGLNISREGDSTAPLGSLCQGSVTLRGKKIFLMFSWNFLCFSLCPLPLVLSLGTTGKSLTPSSWHPPCRYLSAFLRSPLSLFFLLKTQVTSTWRSLYWTTGTRPQTNPTRCSQSTATHYTTLKKKLKVLHCDFKDC